MSFLIDSNTLIYTAKPDGKVIFDWIWENHCHLAQVSAYETMNWPKLRLPEHHDEAMLLQTLIRKIPALSLGSQGEKWAILIAVSAGIKKADTEIAATALLYGLKLVTANTKDFKKSSLLRAFPNLKVLTYAPNERQAFFERLLRESR